MVAFYGRLGAAAAVAATMTTVAAAIAAPETFTLKTISTDSPPDPRFDGMEVSVYHTGAGFGTALLKPANNAVTFYMNKTQIRTNYYNPDTTPGAASFSFPEPEPYFNFEGPATISFGRATDGYYFDDQGTLMWKRDQWHGWLACKWNLGTAAPQIFYLSYQIDYSANILPDTCGQVNLTKVA